MRRTLALFGAGIALGAVAMYFAGGEGYSPPPLAAAARAPELRNASEHGPQPIDFLTLATGSVSSAERAALLRLAAEADPRTLETVIAQVAVLPGLEGRR